MLKRENKNLKERLETADLNVQQFIREMGGLIDQHEFKGSLGDLLRD